LLVEASKHIVEAMADGQEYVLEITIYRGKLIPFHGEVLPQCVVSWRCQPEGEALGNFFLPIEQLLLAKNVVGYCRKFSFLDLHTKN
jgi:hypothetical protein